MRSRATGLAVLVLVAVAALLLGWRLLGDDATGTAEGIDRTGTTDPIDVRLVGKGHASTSAAVEVGTLSGRVTLDGVPASASLDCIRIDGPPLPDDPDARWPWLLDFEPPPSRDGAPVRTEGDGAFTVDLEPGTWHVEAACEDGSRGWTVVGIRAEATTSARLDVRSGTHVLQGRARWADGRPFEGYVLVRTDTEDRYEWTHAARTLQPIAPCTAEGRFRLAPLPPGPAILHAVSPGRILAIRRIQVPWPNEIVWIVDQGYATVTGKVIDAITRAPVPNARLRDAWGSTRNGTQAGPEGAFTLRTDGKTLLVEASGYAPRLVKVPGDGRPLTVVMSANAGISGRVLRADDGTPVEGAVVRAYAHDAPWGVGPTTRSGPNGAWSMADAPSGAVTLIVLGGGFCSEGLGDVRVQAGDPYRVEIPPSGTLVKDLRVVETARLEGRVVEADGSPAEQVRLHVYAPHQSSRHWHAGTPKLSLPDGTFALPDLIPGVAWRFDVLRPPLLEVRGPSLLLRPGEVVQEEIRLPERRHAVILVRDATNDAPIPHAYAVLNDDTVHADAEGRIVVADLPPAWDDEAEPWELEASGYVPMWVDPWASDGEQVVRMTPSLGVSGRIDGLPEGASYDQASLRVAIHVWHPIPVSPDGTFRDPSYPDVADRLFADLEHDGAKWSASAVAEPGATDIVLTLTKQKKTRWWAPVVWQIHVLDPRGRPVPSIVKDVFNCTKSGCSGSTGFRETTGTVIAQHGRSEFGWVRLRQAEDGAGNPLGYAPLLVGPLGPEGGELTVAMEPGEIIAGRVVDESGRGVAGVRVDARCDAHRIPDVRSQPFESLSVATVYADAEGEFEIVGLAPGDHTLIVRGGGRHVAPPVVRVTTGHTDLVIALRTSFAVDVTVEDRRGRPVGGAYVSANRKEGSGASTTADARGLARLIGLDPEDSYVLKASPPGSIHDLRGIEIPDWRPATTTLRLVPGAGLGGRLLGPDDTPVPGTAVYLFRDGKRVNYRHTDVDGRFTFRGLVPGETIGLAPASTKNEKPKIPVLEVTAGTKDVVLRQARGAALRIDVTGLPAMDGLAYVMLLDAATGQTLASADASRTGRAVFPAEDLDPDRTYFAVVAPPDTYPGLVGYRAGVHLRKEPWDVAMRRGEVVRARVTNPDSVGSRPLDVSVGVGYGIRGLLDEQGRIVIPGVPPGRWILTVKDDYRGQVRAQAEVEVPGPEVTLELDEPE